MAYKIDNFWAFVGFPPFRRSQKPEIQQIRGGFGNGFRKRSGLYQIDNFWAFLEFPPFRTNLGRPRSGIYSSPPLLPKQSFKAAELAAVHRETNNLANLLKPQARTSSATHILLKKFTLQRPSYKVGRSSWLLFSHRSLEKQIGWITQWNRLDPAAFAETSNWNLDRLTAACCGFNQFG